MYASCIFIGTPLCIDGEVKKAWSSPAMSPTPPMIFDRRANAYALNSGPNEHCKCLEDFAAAVGAVTDLERCSSSTKGGKTASGVLTGAVSSGRAAGVGVGSPTMLRSRSRGLETRQRNAERESGVTKATRQTLSLVLFLVVEGKAGRIECYMMLKGAALNT